LLGPDTGGTIGANLQSGLCCIIRPIGCIGCGAGGGGGGGGGGCGSAEGGASILCTDCIMLGPET